MTRRFYDHFIRKSYSSSLRGGLGLGAKKDKGATVTNIGAGKK